VVLGGNGELGSYLCPELVSLGHEVVAVCDTDLPPYTKAAPEWHKVSAASFGRPAASPCSVLVLCTAELLCQRQGRLGVLN